MDKLNEYRLVWECRNCELLFKTRVEVNRGNIDNDLEYIHRLIADGGLWGTHVCFENDEKELGRMFGEGQLIRIEVDA